MPPPSQCMIDYSTLPPSGRIRLEAGEDGFTLLIPPLGMWRRARWWLLAGVFLPLIPIVSVAHAQHVPPAYLPRHLVNSPRLIVNIETVLVIGCIQIILGSRYRSRTRASGGGAVAYSSSWSGAGIGLGPLLARE